MAFLETVKNMFWPPFCVLPNYLFLRLSQNIDVCATRSWCHLTSPAMIRDILNYRISPIKSTCPN